jgi:Rrf2 family protein
VHITYKGDYGLKTILHLALNYGGKPLAIAQLSRSADIPAKFLEQILLDLKRGGFVQSRRGKAGGYLLAKPPAQIRLGDVLRFIDGPLAAIACADKSYKGCADAAKCVFREIWQRLAQSTAQVVDGITFADLVKKVKSAERQIAYQI